MICPKCHMCITWQNKLIKDHSFVFDFQFVPIGLLVSALLHRHQWLSAVSGILLSAGIEAMQLLTHRGLFEFDDIVHNGLGALIGFFLFFLLMKTGRRERKKEPSSA